MKKIVDGWNDFEEWIEDNYMWLTAGMLSAGTLAALIPFLMCQIILWRSFR